MDKREDGWIIGSLGWLEFFIGIFEHIPQYSSAVRVQKNVTEDKRKMNQIGVKSRDKKCLCLIIESRSRINGELAGSPDARHPPPTPD